MPRTFPLPEQLRSRLLTSKLDGLPTPAQQKRPDLITQRSWRILFFAPSSSISATINLAPSEENTEQMELPIPEAPPVTIILFDFKRILFSPI